MDNPGAAHQERFVGGCPEAALPGQRGGIRRPSECDPVRTHDLRHATDRAPIEAAC